VLNFVSSFSAIASTSAILFDAFNWCNPQHLIGQLSEQPVVRVAVLLC
jgi:hypothetical protein